MNISNNDLIYYILLLAVMTCWLWLPMLIGIINMFFRFLQNWHKDHLEYKLRLPA